EGVTLNVVAEIGETQVLLDDVLHLQVGDVINLSNTKVDSDMTLKVEGRKKFKCRPGLVGNRVAVQIGDPIDEVPDDLLVTKKEEEEI
ncbi:MAG TPA: FliM/FliN family flagellar motor switch protein, partial [Spirochaetota bacterium]|nr:FliM/FliN family flagellar motor switch protein [Spirochaetota bacterium]